MATQGARPAGKSFHAFKDEILDQYPGVHAKFDERQRTRAFVSGMRRALVAARRRKGLRQKDVAEALGVSQPVISRIEDEAAGDIELGTIFRYAAACGQVPLFTLVGDPSREIAATAEADDDQAVSVR